MSLSACLRLRLTTVMLCAVMISATLSTRASAADQMYFAATDNITNVLVQKINAETVRVDISCWYLTEHALSIALINKFKSGVPVRLIGDRGSIFEIDPLTRKEFYWLASQGLPIRLRFNPTWYPEIDHMKMTLFSGQNLVSFGSANYTPFELAPASSTNYKDETVLFTGDSSIVNAFRTRFDKIWNDTLAEPESLVPSAPYLKDWNDACTNEPTGNCDYFTQFPSPTPMVINTARLEPDYPMPADLIWGQGPDFNNRLVQEINNEHTALQFVIYRLTVDNITNALLAKFTSGVPMQLIIEPSEYLNRKWPEFWLSHANEDKLWAAGVPMKMRIHDGLTHMKTIVTSTYATNASSNYSAAWQRDDDYFIAAAAKPTIYQALKDRVTAMWNDSVGFAPFQPEPPDAAAQLTPASDSSGISVSTPLVWSIAPFAVSYDVYMGTSQANMTLVGNVPAEMDNNPPATYSFKPAAALQPGQRYVWKVVSKTNATAVNPSLIASSSIWAFTTAGVTGPPSAPTSPTPSNPAAGVGTFPTLGWAAGSVGTTFNVAIGTSNPPAQVATGLTTASYAPGTLLPSTTYFWRVTAVSSGGTTVGSVWSFTTGSGGGSAPTEVVLYASDATPHGAWTTASDPTAAGGLKLTNPDAGAAALSGPLANPTNYFDATFQAQAGTVYRVWLRIHAIGDSKWNDSVFVQFSDSVDSGNSPTYRIGTPGGYVVNLWTCSDCQSFGWGWQRYGYWLADTGDVWFQNSGTHTIRVQTREDGAEIDQIVLIPSNPNPPGPVSNDTTIVPKPTTGTAPGLPASPSPANAAVGASPNPTLTWSASGATSYDVAFGTTNPPALVVSGVSATSYTPPALSNGTTYFWQIIARNATGSTSGAVWRFTTSVAAPATPNSPSPADGSTLQPTSMTLTWSAAGATSYDVLFGPTDPPSQVVSGITTASYTATGLTPGATYFWQIVAHNGGGANQGPEWTFSTVPPAAPPTVPTSPTPANTLSGVSLSATLSWSATSATAYTVMFGTTNPPPQAVTGRAAASFSPTLAASTTYFWQIVATNAAGSTTGPLWSFTTAAAPPPPVSEVVIYASDVPPANLHGSWTTASDPTSANGIKLVTPDNGFASTDVPVAAPTHYVDVTFTADANTPYALWLRMQALNNNKYNDSIWVQFSDALAGGSAIYPLGSTSALDVNLATDAGATSLNRWGWQNGAYWLSQPTTVTFATGGTHTMRIQLREDGVQIDQIVLSAAHYLHASPGGVTLDATIVPKP